MQQWEKLKKNRSRLTATQKSNEDALQESFADLFDIAHQDAFWIINNLEDKALKKKNIV